MTDNKYIGVDLGAWYGNKTRTAILEKSGEILKLVSVEKEKTYSTKPPKERDKALVNCLLQKANNNAIIAIDAPFNIPSALKGKENTEEYYDINEYLTEKKSKSRDIRNQYLFDNSARFVMEKTGKKALAPAATFVGSLTTRMTSIIDNYKELKICKTPYLNKNGISVIEVYPTATLSKLTDTIPKYKGNKDNWSKNKGIMFALICPYISNLNTFKEFEEKIKCDDDYDAIVCALTAYFIDKNGFETPKENDIDKFTNSFIFIPEIKNASDELVRKCDHFKKL